MIPKNNLKNAPNRSTAPVLSPNLSIGHPGLKLLQC